MRSGCTVRRQKAADCDLFLLPPCATVPLMKPQIRGEALTRLPWDDCIFAVCVCSPEARSAAFNRRALLKSKNETGGRKNDKRSSSDRCMLVELKQRFVSAFVILVFRLEVVRGRGATRNNFQQTTLLPCLAEQHEKGRKKSPKQEEPE